MYQAQSIPTDQPRSTDVSFLEGMFYVLTFIALCLGALVINEDMAIQGRYKGADQYLSSLYK